LYSGINETDKEDLPGLVVMGMDIPKRLDSVLADLEFELWNAMISNELSDGDIEFGFTITRNGRKENVKVTISIRTIKNATD
jgi:hypothetical protein